MEINSLKIQTVVMRFGWFEERMRGEKVYFAPRMMSRVKLIAGEERRWSSDGSMSLVKRDAGRATEVCRWWRETLVERRKYVACEKRGLTHSRRRLKVLRWDSWSDRFYVLEVVCSVEACACRAWRVVAQHFVYLNGSKTVFVGGTDAEGATEKQEPMFAA